MPQLGHFGPWRFVLQSFAPTINRFLHSRLGLARSAYDQSIFPPESRLHTGARVNFVLLTHILAHVQMLRYLLTAMRRMRSHTHTPPSLSKATLDEWNFPQH